MHRIQITHASQLPVAALFDALADHGRLGKVFGAPVRRIRDGDTEPNGVGSVRRIGFGPLAVEETVTAFERNRSIDYRITRGGFPIRDHRGHVALPSRAQAAVWTGPSNSDRIFPAPVRCWRFCSNVRSAWGSSASAEDVVRGTRPR